MRTLGSARALAAALPLVLAACAVTKIDVDVYKGPLANHRDVQTEQMAVMAVGALPLIDRLHEELKTDPATAQIAGLVGDIKDLYETQSSSIEPLIVRGRTAFARYENALATLDRPSPTPEQQNLVRDLVAVGEQHLGPRLHLRKSVRREAPKGSNCGVRISRGCLSCKG